MQKNPWQLDWHIANSAEQHFCWALLASHRPHQSSPSSGISHKAMIKNIHKNILHQYWLTWNISDDSDSKCTSDRFDHPWAIFCRCSPPLPFSQKVVADMIVTMIIIFTIIITMINDQNKSKLKTLLVIEVFFQRAMSSCEVARTCSV